MNNYQPSTTHKVIFTGLGGQGIVFLTRLFAQTAVALGYPVMASEIHGMSQRGGPVISHFKIGNDQAPLVQQGTADLMIALKADEAVRNLPFLRRGGVIFVNKEKGLVKEVQPHLERLNITVYSLDASSLAAKLGDARRANVVMAGFVIAHSLLPFSLEIMQEIMIKKFSRSAALNIQAMKVGFETGQSMLHKDSD